MLCASWNFRKFNIFVSVRWNELLCCLEKSPTIQQKKLRGHKVSRGNRKPIMQHNLSMMTTFISPQNGCVQVVVLDINWYSNGDVILTNLYLQR